MDFTSKNISSSGKKDASNLLRFRNSNLGMSAPSISIAAKDLSIGNKFRNRNMSSYQKINYKSTTNISLNLPRPQSPYLIQSPLESPKLSFSNFNALFNPVKKFNSHKNDYRRWSVASLPSSSGYGTTPTSSNFSSKYSSQEKLLQFLSLNRDDNFSSHEDNNFNSGLIQNEILLIQRSRSRSLSPTRNVNYNPISEISVMNTWYKERFPKATQQMEEKLKKFILNNSVNDDHLKLNSYPIIRFVHHQILELAKDCLHKSESKLITSYYFYEMTEKLEKLIIEAKEKSDNEIEAMNYIVSIVNRLLIIISRPARLLQCLEFDPEEFYHVLEMAEGEARNVQGIKTDIPRYILEKLGLHHQLHCRCNHQRRSRHRTRRTRNCLCNKCTNKKNTDSCDKNDVLYWSDNENISCFACSTPKLQSLTKSVENVKLCDKNTKIMNSPNIHNFEVIKLISNGAYGAVHLVKHKQTRQRFAMKKINKSHIVLRNQVDQVFAERDILSFTDNPFVVSMFCSFETKRDLCLVMEYVEGGDCATLLKNIGALPLDIARFYFAETVLAVEYLHNYGIVHRDLKPDNLLITALGHIKLTDFGLSKMGLMSLATNLYEGFIESQEFSDKQVIGTPEYIAPEVILRQGYGKPVDWWSMGIILYEFLTGTVPFFGETPEELFAHTVNDDIEWPEETEEWSIQAEAKSIIAALLQHSPRDRLGSSGAHQVKEHIYFLNVDWNSLLRQKAEFIPQLDNDEDTSYFDSRSDRYNHNFENESDNDYNDHSVFSLFSSCSSNYRKVQDLSSYSENEKEKVITTQKLKLDSGILNSTPDLSQTDSDDISPQVQRKKKTFHYKDDISNESSKKASFEQSKIRGIIKSASTSGLSTIIRKNYDNSDNTSLLTLSPTKGEGSSTTSSRDSSPCRELIPLVTNPKPAIDIKKGRKGFGFTLHTIRVYIGDSNFYTIHHLVLNVDEHGSAFKAGLRPGDLITHINGETIQGLNHTQVLKLLLGSGNRVNIVATELKHTSIQSGGRKRDPKFSKLAKNRNHKKQTRKEFDKKKKSSLFRKISSKKANVDIQQIAANKGYSSQMSMTSSRSFQSFTPKTENINYVHRIPAHQRSNRLSVSSDSPFSSSSSSSSSTSSPNVIIDQTSISQQQNYQRPSSLHGLKQKLHPKNLHVTTPPVQNRRKSVAGHIPVSPLARTPSPSPLPISPTRSPSPLAFSLNTASYQLGSSNSIQLYSPNSITITANKKSFIRNKNSEPSSPLLFRRTLSPDRTTFASNTISTRHNTDLKHSLISPLCSNLTNPINNKTKHFNTAIWNNIGIDLQESNYELKNDVDLDKKNLCSNELNLGNSGSESSENLITNNELLPRIAEEKDSPTNPNPNQLSK